MYECTWSKIKLAIILVHKIIINRIIWPDQNWIRCRSAEAIGWNWLSSQNLNAHFSYPASNRIRRSIMQNLSWYILVYKTKKYLHHYCHHVPNSGISIVQPCSHHLCAPAEYAWPLHTWIYQSWPVFLLKTTTYICSLTAHKVLLAGDL